MQPATAAPAVEATPVEEQSTTPVQEPEPAPVQAEEPAIVKASTDQTTQPQPEEPSEPVAEPQMEPEPSLEEPVQESVQAQGTQVAETNGTTSSALDAAIQATLDAVATEEPPRDSMGTPALYEADPASADVPKVDTPTIVPPASSTTSKPPPTKPTSSLSRVAQLAQRVDKNPLDGEAQLALLQEVESKGDLERTREVYEKFLSTFPDAVSCPHLQRGLARLFYSLLSVPEKIERIK